MIAYYTWDPTQVNGEKANKIFNRDLNPHLMTMRRTHIEYFLKNVNISDWKNMKLSLLLWWCCEALRRFGFPGGLVTRLSFFCVLTCDCQTEDEDGLAPHSGAAHFLQANRYDLWMQYSSLCVYTITNHLRRNFNWRLKKLLGRCRSNLIWRKKIALSIKYSFKITKAAGKSGLCSPQLAYNS